MKRYKNHGVVFQVGKERRHSFYHFHMYLKPVTIPYPEVKTDYVDIPAYNGSIDYSDLLGEVFYKNRKFSLSFEIEDIRKFDGTLEELARFVDGKRVKMSFYFDKRYYYVGRVQINNYKSSGNLGEIVLDIECEPFKYKNEETYLVLPLVNVSLNNIAYVKNGKKPVRPYFKVDKNINTWYEDVSFKYKGKEFMVRKEDDFVFFEDVIFYEGDNKLEFTNVHLSNLIVKFQEGDL